MFQSQFDHLEKLEDIENAIHFNQQAVDLTPDGYAYKPFMLSNLGSAFQSRFEHLRELGDNKNTIHFYQQALDLMPDGHVNNASQLINLNLSILGNWTASSRHLQLSRKLQKILPAHLQSNTMLLINGKPYPQNIRTPLQHLMHTKWFSKFFHSLFGLDRLSTIVMMNQPKSASKVYLELKLRRRPYRNTHYPRIAASDEAIVKTVKNEMSEHDIVHLACHGIQDPKNPLDSAFVLHDGRLKLQDLMHLSLENAELAFLSACQTAAGDQNLPEEAVHLAAGMLAVRYPSVIATMWSIGDNDAPIVADKVYKSVMGCGNEVVTQNQRQSAVYALHDAVEYLRKEIGEMNFVKWVPFVHYGV
ncbi:hypothetical protein D9758_011336 [Tetrapyrgos nigripes]|uniref:CHAT domain-containing protein n=1 Tax=Tetrapyrgos nigripes TaxID=182062 RepID=A0A8H5G899_9AGAR|nr:hypothetical protein D9758_011336 [Tetrapyrgos nigripes]